jgi:hypothetical protein
MRHYLPYQLAVTALHIATGVFVYLYARPRVGAWLALVPAALMLSLGAAWEDVMWAFQVTFIGSVAFGMAALVALDARRYKLACLALVLSLTSSGLGLAFLITVAVELTLDPRQRRRAMWVVGIPFLVAAGITVGYHGTATTQSSSLSHTIRFALEMGTAGFGAFGGIGGGFGHPLAVLAVIGVVVVARRDGGLAPRVIGLLCGAVAFWLITGLSRADLGLAPSTSRYLYVSCALLLALAVSLPRRPVVGQWGGAVLAAATLLACISGAGLFKEGAATRINNTTTLLPKLTALEVARGHVLAGLQIDPGISPDIIARDYYSARDKFGTPALPVATVRAAGDDRRQVFDAALVTALGISLKPGAGGSGACTSYPPAAELTLPTGAAYTLSSSAPATVSLRRLATTYPQDALPLPGRAAATLTLPRDHLPDPWHVRLAGTQPVKVCR